MTDSNPEGAAMHAVALMADVSVCRRSADTARTWIGEAHAAFDQALTEAGTQRDFSPGPDFWVARASAAAALASAEQARIGNLIAWKQLRQSASASALPGGGDAIADEIEAALGIGDGSSS